MGVNGEWNCGERESERERSDEESKMGVKRKRKRIIKSILVCVKEKEEV